MDDKKAMFYVFIGFMAGVTTTALGALVLGLIFQ